MAQVLKELLPERFRRLRYKNCIFRGKHIDAFAFFLTALTVRKPEIIVGSSRSKMSSVENLTVITDSDCNLTTPISLVTYIQWSRGLAGC